MFYYPIDNDLQLRLFEPHHAEALFALCDRNRDHLRPWLPWIERTQAVSDSLGYIKMMRAGYGAGTDIAVGLWFHGELAGALGIHRIDTTHKSAEIGYWISADMQGKGIITRACRAMVAHALGDLGLNRISIRVNPHNTRSRAIPERLGFVKEGTLRQVMVHYDAFVDLVYYSMLASDWEHQP